MLSGRRILLVEDNELNCEIAAELLQMQGLTVDMAENGQLALEKFRESGYKEYDCILTDIQMPVMNGCQATNAIRSLSRNDAQDIPILMKRGRHLFSTSERR